MNQIPAILHSILGVAFGVILFLLLFGGMLWLMGLTESRHFMRWLA